MTFEKIHLLSSWDSEASKTKYIRCVSFFTSELRVLYLWKYSEFRKVHRAVYFNSLRLWFICVWVAHHGNHWHLHKNAFAKFMEGLNQESEGRVTLVGGNEAVRAVAWGRNVISGVHQEGRGRQRQSTVIATVSSRRIFRQITLHWAPSNSKWVLRRLRSSLLTGCSPNQRAVSTAVSSTAPRQMMVSGSSSRKLLGLIEISHRAHSELRLPVERRHNSFDLAAHFPHPNAYKNQLFKNPTCKF